MERGAAARAGGGVCARGGDDEMPDLNLFLNGLPQTVPHIPSLDQLKKIIQQYKDNPTSPTLKSQIKDQILRGALDSILLVLNDLFGNPTNLQGGTLKPECLPVFRSILDALMDDLPLHTYIKMLFQICMKSYYNDSAVRVALGAAFVGSTLYTTWVTAITPIATLSIEVGGYVMTMCNTILNFATDPIQLQGLLNTFFAQQQAMGYADNIVSQATVFFEYLKGQAVDPRNLLLICALTHIWFMDKIFPAENFRPLDELRQAAAANPAVVPVPILQNSLAFGPGQGQDDLFTQMTAPLRQAGGIIGSGVKQYLMTTVNRIRKLSYVMPGVVVRPENTIQAKCLTFMLSISDYIVTHADDQAVAADRDSSVIKATIALRSMFDTEPLLNQTPTQVAGVIHTLAFSIRNRVIENIRIRLPAGSQTFEAAAALLERTCLVFKSRLTEAEVREHILNVCVVGRIQWLLDNTTPSNMVGAEDSLTAVKDDSQPLDERDAQADNLLQIRFKAGDTLFFTIEEIEKFQQAGFSIFTSIQKGLSIGIGSMVKCAQMLGIISFTTDLMTQLRNTWNPPTVPHKLVCADTSIERLLTKPFIRQIRIIDEIIRTGLSDKKSPEKIYDDIMTKFQEGEQVARPFIEHLLMLGILEEKLHLHDMEVAFGFIAKGKEVNLAVVLNSDTTKFSDNFIRMITEMAAPAPVLAASAADLVASPPVAPSEEGVFNGLRREIQNVVCQSVEQSTQSASDKASDVIIAGADALEALEPRMDQAPVENTAAAALVSEVNGVMRDMIKGLDKTGPGVGGMVLAAAILDQEQNEEESSMKQGSGSGSLSAAKEFGFSDDTANADKMEEPEKAAAEARAAADLNPRERDRSNSPIGHEHYQMDGGKSRRKSRKNAKKTTRRNKKIVRKSSKNTKQRRSSRRSSRKSRK